MSSISAHTNLKDRVFVTENGSVKERRYINGNWTWIDHQALNQYLGGKGTVLGPCLVNTSENVGRLFIRTRDIYDFNSSGKTIYVTNWVLYNFNQNLTDYSDLNNFQVGNYTPLSFNRVPCSTNFSVSADWKLYGLAPHYSQTGETEKNLLMTRFDLDLNVIEQSQGGMPRFRISDNPSYDDGYITERDSKNVRPAIMSNHDVLTTTGNYMYHANIDMGLSQHGNKQFMDVGEGFDDKVFGIRDNGRLFARRFDQDKHKWVWDDHGRPVKKKHFRKYVVGSLRKLNDGILFIIKPKWKNPDDNFRVYHRWQDTEGGWHWADHGYPDSETICEIGPAWDNKFFVRTTSGKLYERHWNSGIQQWAWENHGAP